MLVVKKKINDLNSDKPISREEDDLLGRHPLAYRIADMINNLGDDYKDSVVIGIEGEWGAGKTSFINLILNKVRPNEKNLVIEFNPWNFSNQNELIKDFFNSIVAGPSQPKNEDSNWRKLLAKISEWSAAGSRVRLLRLFIWVLKLFTIWPFKLLVWLFRPVPQNRTEETIESYASKLFKYSEVSVSPSVSISAILVSITFKLTRRWQFHREKSVPLKKQKNEIDKFIRNTRKRRIIVIDDIDRLDSEETKLIFKLVKLATDFQNTVFLLAYDRVKVSKRLDERDVKNGIKGEEYLRKIVQVPFLIPKPAKEKIQNVLIDSILKELRYYGTDENWDTERFRHLVESKEFSMLFPTIRDMRRYTNSLRIDLKIIHSDEKEVNQVDFVGVEAIRVFAPEMYLAMTNEKITFTVTESPKEDKDVSSWIKDRNAQVEKILEKAPEELRDSIRKIIFQLFPQLRISETGFLKSREAYFSREYKAYLRKKLMVSSEDMYDRYFLLSVPRKLVSESELRGFLSATDIQGLLVKLEKFMEQGKLRPLSERLGDHLEDLTDQQKENLLIGTFEFTGHIMEDMSKDKKPPALHFKDMLAVFNWELSRDVLEAIEPAKTTEILMQIIDTTEGLYQMTQFFDCLNSEGQEAWQGEGTFLNLENRIKLNKAYSERMKKVAKDGPIASINGWGCVLQFLKAWDSEEKVKEYVTELLRTDDGLVVFLKGFMGVGVKNFDMDGLATFIDLHRLDDQVNKLDLSSLREDGAEVVKLYKTSRSHS